MQKKPTRKEYVGFRGESGECSGALLCLMASEATPAQKSTVKAEPAAAGKPAQVRLKSEGAIEWTSRPPLAHERFRGGSRLGGSLFPFVERAQVHVKEREHSEEGIGGAHQYLGAIYMGNRNPQVRLRLSKKTRRRRLVRLRLTTKTSRFDCPRRPPAPGIDFVTWTASPTSAPRPAQAPKMWICASCQMAGSKCSKPTLCPS